MASFSYEMTASPLPPVNVCIDARPLLSCTGTFLNSAVRYIAPVVALAPLFDFAPYPARMFHLAPPEVNGFGVSTCTPGLIRSSQVLMPLGLPLRVAMTATESVIIPWYWSLFQP